MHWNYSNTCKSASRPFLPPSLPLGHSGLAYYFRQHTPQDLRHNHMHTISSNHNKYDCHRGPSVAIACQFLATQKISFVMRSLGSGFHRSLWLCNMATHRPLSSIQICSCYLLFVHKVNGEISLRLVSCHAEGKVFQIFCSVEMSCLFWCF